MYQQFINIQAFNEQVREYNKLLCNRGLELTNSLVKNPKGLENFKADVEIAIIKKELDNQVFELNPFATLFQSNLKIAKFLAKLEIEDSKGRIDSKTQISRYQRYNTLLREVISDYIEIKGEHEMLLQIQMDKDIFIIEQEIENNAVMIKVLRGKAPTEQIDINAANSRMDKNIASMNQYLVLLDLEASCYQEQVTSSLTSNLDKNFAELMLFRINADIAAKKNFINSYKSRKNIIHTPLNK